MSYESQDPIESLTRLLARLPALGPRSAKRIALHLLQQKETLMRPLAEQIIETADKVKECSECGNIDVNDPCHICTKDTRDAKLLCVVASVADLWAMERSGSYKGKYHVLGGVLSALDGITPEDLKIQSLLEKVGSGSISELIFALPATVDGQSTSHYIAERIEKSDTLTITKLAHGVPVGGELDYLDEGTLMTALKSRRAL